MAALSNDMKDFIVKRLACFETPSEVASAVLDQFGVKIERQQVSKYHADATEPPAKRWVAIFEATRKKFLDDTGAIPVAQRSYRLQELDKMSRKAREKGNFVLAASLMEQAAKECGDAYTNKLKLTGGDGGPIAHTVTVEFVKPDA